MSEHVYIAGPMRGYDGFNFPAFFAAEQHLRSIYPEAEVVNPARLDADRDGLAHLIEDDPSGLLLGRHLTRTFDVEEGSFVDIRKALADDLAYITDRCDLIVALPGWRDSKGATCEVATANALGIKVVTLDAEVIEHGVAVLSALGGVAFYPLSKAPEGKDTAPEPQGPQIGSMDGQEVRLTSATGGQKGSKEAQFDQIPPDALWRLAEHFGKGARKYDAHNFRKGYAWSLSYNAALRHVLDFWGGKDWDVCPPDAHGCLLREGETYTETENGPTCFNHTGSHHLDAFMWHAVVLRTFYDEYPEYDDRYRPPEPEQASTPGQARACQPADNAWLNGGTQ